MYVIIMITFTQVLICIVDSTCLVVYVFSQVQVIENYHTES